MLTQIQYDAITHEGLKARSRSGKDIFVPADTVILATGQRSNNTLQQEMAGQMEQCFLIGAARGASETNCQAAIWEAAEIARKI